MRAVKERKLPDHGPIHQRDVWRARPKRVTPASLYTHVDLRVTDGRHAPHTPRHMVSQIFADRGLIGELPYERQAPVKLPRATTKRDERRATARALAWMARAMSATLRRQRRAVTPDVKGRPTPKRGAR